MFALMVYFLLFIIYSFIGWLIEVTCIKIITKRFSNRGFLIGPYCPIYGFSALIIISNLSKYHNNPITLFILIVVIASIMEYITSYFMEKLFNARWWDYSHKSFNINGRICLMNSLLFGFLGLSLVYFINPFLSAILLKANNTLIIYIGFIVLILFLIDFIISFNIISKIELAIDETKRDHTDEISSKVKTLLSQKSFFTKRLINAFPNLKTLNRNLKNRILNKKTNK